MARVDGRNGLAMLHDKACQMAKDGNLAQAKANEGKAKAKGGKPKEGKPKRGKAGGKAKFRQDKL